MERFIVSARKYRPATFASVIGQEAITTTLKNAIKNGQLAQAYLFCGPRGVGKTTCARIFAKTINCYHLDENTEPCNQCESCQAFNESRSYNIHELDAASNNSVDDIRNLIDQVRIPPQIGKYSVYIIDEVHMLSAAAFNAFLKTLEEPPRHAIFILATTEKHKILPTILSRCQIFDFNRIKVRDIVNHLADIASREQITAEPDALNIIALKAEGAMRDALSIFDQIVSFSGGQVTYANVIKSLNILDYEYYFRVTDSFLENDTVSVLLLFNEILEHGFDAQNFIISLGNHFRDLLVCKDPKTIDLLDVGEGIRLRYLEQSAKCDPAFLLQAIDICTQCDIQFRTSRNPRLMVELSLLKLAGLTTEKKKNKVNQLDDKAPAAKEITVKKTEKTVTDKPDQQQPVGKKQTIITSPASLSLKNILSPGNPSTGKLSATAADSDDSPVVEEPAAFENEAFGEDQLTSVYREFVQQLKSEKPRLYSILLSKKPVLKENYAIHLLMDNETQVEDFNLNVKTELLQYLRKTLNNSAIYIVTDIEEKESPRRIYTAEEKFQELASRNPLLNKMRKDFNLDFD
ncbi:MAG: DNA polymerase III subunit gamma/tau [Bacteroidales bacterium]